MIPDSSPRDQSIRDPQWTIRDPQRTDRELSVSVQFPQWTNANGCYVPVSNYMYCTRKIENVKVSYVKGAMKGRRRSRGWRRQGGPAAGSGRRLRSNEHSRRPSSQCRAKSVSRVPCRARCPRCPKAAASSRETCCRKGRQDSLHGVDYATSLRTSHGNSWAVQSEHLRIVHVQVLNMLE